MSTERDVASPRPWKVEERLSGSENHRGFRIVGPFNSIGTWPLADVQPGDEDGHIGRANATLIVRAVNAHDGLLKAARRIIRQAEHAALGDAYPEVTWEAVAALRAAIAAVEGETL